MKRKNNRRGFTMAELLIVVAIIVILTGVSFVAVQAHQKNLAQLEADTVAKEIFFAAQNHLTMAEGQGYLGDSVSFGLHYEKDPKDVYYFTVPSTNPNSPGTALNLMLPFGSIDDTIRSVGNYVIRYQSKPARVLDVWYGRASNQAFTGKHDANPAGLGIAELIKQARADKPNYGAVIGHYGGDEALEGGAILNAPYIEVENAERLIVRIKTADVNKDPKTGNEIKDADGNAVSVSVKLIIRGKTSGAMAAIPVLPDQNQRVKASTTDGFDYDIILDDITMAYDTGRKDGGHFADITTDMASTTSTTVPAIDVLAGAAFIPGENITVQAVAFSNTALASIDYSNEWTTNSLFADVEDESEADSEGVPPPGKIALISNMRHLANLDRMISGVNTVNTGKLSIVAAQQTADLIWSSKTKNPDAFTEAIQNACVYKKGESTHTDEGYWLPLNIDYDLIYEGAEPGDTDAADDADKVARSHSITGVKVSAKDGNPAGLFGTVGANVTIRNMELIDFDITAASGNAGALAGTLSNPDGAKVTVQNILAHNSGKYDTDKAMTATVKSGSGAAGGLIGKMTGADVVKCAAALVVESTNGNAGGLVGESNGGSIKASYSGGHTNAHSYYKNGAAIYNVTAGRYAGGLVGNVGFVNIDHCYSTCSASGDNAGGLVGRTEGPVENSYATGLVNGTNAGAIAGNILSSNQFVNCQYLEIINEITTGGAVSYLPPVPGWAPSDETKVPTGSVKLTGVSRADYSAASYADFSGAKADWKDALSYDGTLINLYNVESDSGEKQPKYNFNTVEQLGDVAVVAEADETDPVDFVATHYGDWPAPETLVVNE